MFLNKNLGQLCFHMATEEVVSTCRKEKQNNSVVDKKTGLNHIVLGLF